MEGVTLYLDFTKETSDAIVHSDLCDSEKIRLLRALCVLASDKHKVLDYNGYQHILKIIKAKNDQRAAEDNTQ